MLTIGMLIIGWCVQYRTIRFFLTLVVFWERRYDAWFEILVLIVVLESDVFPVPRHSFTRHIHEWFAVEFERWNVFSMRNVFGYRRAYGLSKTSRQHFIEWLESDVFPISKHSLLLDTFVSETRLNLSDGLCVLNADVFSYRREKTSRRARIRRFSILFLRHSELNRCMEQSLMSKQKVSGLK